jgi:hypothetical protein
MMYYLLIGSVLPEFDRYLVIYIFLEAILTSKELGSDTND